MQNGHNSNMGLSPRSHKQNISFICHFCSSTLAYWKCSSLWWEDQFETELSVYQLRQSWRLSHYICLFSHCFDKVPDKHSLRKEGFILAQVWDHSPSEWRSHGSSSSMKQLVTLYLQSGAERRDECWFSAHFLFLSGQDASPCHAATHSQGGSSLLS